VALTPPRPPALPFLGDLLPPPPALDEIPLPLLLPGIDQDGQNRPSVSLLSLKEFTDLVAPKLTQEEEIFAIGLADGAREFFGDEVGDLLKGERVLSPQSIVLVLKAVRSGALGRNDLFDLNSDASRSVIQFVENALNVVRRRGPTSQSSDFEADLTEALDNLTESERAQLDEIINELTQRAIQRATARLSNVERLL